MKASLKGEAVSVTPAGFWLQKLIWTQGSAYAPPWATRPSPPGGGLARRTGQQYNRSYTGTFFVERREKMKVNQVFVGALLSFSILVFSGCTPKPSKQPKIGEPLIGLTKEQLAQFNQGKMVFQRVFTPEDGLGPLFDGNARAECHEDPVAGGVGDEVEVHATRFIPPNTCDPLFQEGGPVIQQNATPLLQAHGIQKEEIPPSATSQARRTTPPVFGFGLIDAIPDETILAYEDPNDKDGDGISGRANRAIDGRLGRF